MYNNQNIRDISRANKGHCAEKQTSYKKKIYIINYYIYHQHSPKSIYI